MLDYRREVKISVCGIVIRFVSEEPLLVEDHLAGFLTDAVPDYTVSVRIGRRPAAKPAAGGDILTDYGERDGLCVLSAKMPWEQDTLIVTEYTPDLAQIVIWLNTLDYTPSTLLIAAKLLQYFPIRELLCRERALLLHSSRIVLEGRAIVFAGPSQSGKTTQAGLWNRVCDTPVVSNDRSVLRMTGGRVVTSGYPADGSAPVYDAGQIPLGAIVLLQKGEENRIEELSAARAMRLLFAQTAFDDWNEGQISALLLLWAEILQEYPALLLTCRADETAPVYLYEKLTETGVTAGWPDR